MAKSPLSESELLILAEAARGAGAEIMKFVTGGQKKTRAKKDSSPVTDADIAAHDFLHKALGKAFPHIPVISEEDASHIGAAPERFFLVDPLDGTLSFIRGEDEFTVNIGLVEGTRPVSGVLYAPAMRVLYLGGQGVPPVRWHDGGEREPIAARPMPIEGAIVTRSRSHAKQAAQAFLDTLHIQSTRPASSAIKFCWLAEGSADIYPRFGRTMEWDTAAGQAILEAAGGGVYAPGGAPLTYGKPGFENPGFIARGI